MAIEYELTLQDYLSILRRRGPYLIGIFVVGLLIAVVVALVLPPTYRATGTIMVESQQVSDNVVTNAVNTQLDDQIDIIKQRVMTRENLLRIANQYSLFKENKGSLTTTELLDKMRDRIIVESDGTDNAARSGKRGQQAIAFTLSFEDRHPEIALQVTKDLVALFLDWNVKLRTDVATETTAFLTQESDKLKNEVERLEQLISAYKQQNKNALPEQLTLRMTMSARAENDLHEVERDIRSTKEELRSLEVELSAAKQGSGEGSLSQSLPALKAEYARLSATYNESYPDMKALKRKIESMEKSGGTPETGLASSETPSLSVYRIQAKIASNNARLSSLAQQREILQSKINQNERAMVLTPQVEQGLDVLIRDRDSAQRKYEELRNKKMNAQITQSLESENKSERFTLLEPPLLPEKPFKPNRIKIVAMGFFIALLSSGGGIMVLETIDKRIRGSEALAHVLGYRPLVVIPYLPIHEEGIRRKHMIKMAIFAAVVIMILTIVALHFLYMPLDMMFIKVLARLG